MTDPLAEENAPTRPMPTPPDPWRTRGAANTGPTIASETRPVYAPPSAYQSPAPSAYPQTPVFYQPPPMPMPQGAMPPYVPPRSNSTSWVLIVAVIILTVLGGAIIGGRAIVRKVREKIATRTSFQSKEVVEQQTYALSANANVSLKTISGSITVGSTDQPQAEVRIIKRGNSDEAIQATQVAIKNDNGNLSLEVLPGPNNTDVRFEVKLPGKVGPLTLNSISGSIKVADLSGQINATSVSGSIKVADFEGPIAVTTTSGSISLADTRGATSATSTSGSITLNDVSGVERVETTSGTIKAEVDSVSAERPVSFKSLSGTIELTLNPEVNATLEASTQTGSIRVSEELNIAVQKSTPGARANGTLGKGGQPLSISTLSGSIRLNQ